jgi:hydrogenase maturation protease
VVIGIGNIVRSDDGLGVRALQRLRESHRYPPGVELIDGGTIGLLLLPHLAGARLAIIIDAINTGVSAGDLIRLVDPIGPFATGLTPHDVGLADLLDAARMTDAWPQTLILHGVQPSSTAIGTELTPPVMGALDRLAGAINADLSAWGYPPCGASRAGE